MPGGGKYVLCPIDEGLGYYSKVLSESLIFKKDDATRRYANRKVYEFLEKSFDLLPYVGEKHLKVLMYRFTAHNTNSLPFNLVIKEVDEVEATILTKEQIETLEGFYCYFMDEEIMETTKKDLKKHNIFVFIYVLLVIAVVIFVISLH